MPHNSEIVVQADLGGFSLAFTEAVPEGMALDAINGRLDLYAKAIGRQRAKISLSEKLVDLLAAQKTLAASPAREAEMLKNHAAERARQVASWEAAHSASGKRAPFQLGQPHRDWMQKFDEETERQRKRLHDEREGLRLQIPVLEAQISRLRAVIAGRDPVEPLEAEAESLKTTAA